MSIREGFTLDIFVPNPRGEDRITISPKIMEFLHMRGPSRSLKISYSKAPYFLREDHTRPRGRVLPIPDESIC